MRKAILIALVVAATVVTALVAAPLFKTPAPPSTFSEAASMMTRTAVSVSLLFVWIIAAVVVTLMSGREVRYSSIELRSSPLHCFALGLVAVTSFVLTAILFSYLIPYLVGIPLLVALAVFAVLTKVYGTIAVFHAIGTIVADRRADRVGHRVGVRRRHRAGDEVRPPRAVVPGVACRGNLARDCEHECDQTESDDRRDSGDAQVESIRVAIEDRRNGDRFRLRRPLGIVVHGNGRTVRMRGNPHAQFINARIPPPCWTMFVVGGNRRDPAFHVLSSCFEGDPALCDVGQSNGVSPSVFDDLAMSNGGVDRGPLRSNLVSLPPARGCAEEKEATDGEREAASNQREHSPSAAGVRRSRRLHVRTRSS